MWSDSSEVKQQNLESDVDAKMGRRLQTYWGWDKLAAILQT